MHLSIPRFRMGILSEVYCPSCTCAHHLLQPWSVTARLPCGAISVSLTLVVELVPRLGCGLVPSNVIANGSSSYFNFQG